MRAEQVGETVWEEAGEAHGGGYLSKVILINDQGEIIGRAEGFCALKGENVTTMKNGSPKSNAVQAARSMSVTRAIGKVYRLELGDVAALGGLSPEAFEDVRDEQAPKQRRRPATPGPESRPANGERQGAGISAQEVMDVLKDKGLKSLYDLDKHFPEGSKAQDIRDKKVMLSRELFEAAIVGFEEELRKDAEQDAASAEQDAEERAKTDAMFDELPPAPASAEGQAQAQGGAGAARGRQAGSAGVMARGRKMNEQDMVIPPDGKGAADVGGAMSLDIDSVERDANAVVGEIEQARQDAAEVGLMQTVVDYCNDPTESTRLRLLGAAVEFERAYGSCPLRWARPSRTRCCASPRRPTSGRWRRALGRRGRTSPPWRNWSATNQRRTASSGASCWRRKSTG